MREEPEYQIVIEWLPCAACGRPPRSIFCHCRISVFGNVVVPINERGGGSLKPYDKWGWPGCDPCHSRQHESSQRNHSERHFWEQLGINPLALCEALYRNRDNRGACLGILQRARMGATL